MKATIVLLIVSGISLTVASGPGAAADAPVAEALAKKYGCVACHAADKNLSGPSFKEIAAKYKNDVNAELKLMNVIKSGGSGVWGPTPMPASPQVKDGERQTLVQWILSM